MKIRFTILLILVSCTFINAQTNVFQSKIDSLNNVITGGSSTLDEQAKIYSQIANYYSKQENYSESKKNNLKALKIFNSLKNHRNSCKVLLDLAMNYDKSNQFDEAIKYSFEALDILELFKDDLKKDEYDFRKGMILMNMGIIYGQIDNNTESLKLLQKSKILLSNAPPFYQAVCNENLGIANLELLNFGSALEYFDLALKFYFDNDVEPMLISNTLNNVGNIHIATREYKKALIIFKQALTFIDKNEIYLSEKTGVLNSIGDVYIELDSLEKAKLYLDKSRELSQGKGGKRFIKENYKSRVKLHAKQKDFKSAFKDLKILNSIEDSLYEPKLLEKIANIKSEYDLKVEQRENLLKIQLLEREKQLDSYKYYVLIGFVLLIICFGILLYNRQKQKAKLKNIELKNAELEKIQLSDKLKYKNNQLTNYAIYIIKKNEFLDDIKSEIDKLKNESDSKLNSLSKIVNQHIIASQDRKDFEIRVKNENQDFYYKLDSKFPDLSEKNKNLCTLLLLDLTSKEIASLLNISVDSVEKSRYRLRKKMEIPKESTISSYLKSI